MLCGMRETSTIPPPSAWLAVVLNFAFPTQLELIPTATAWRRHPRLYPRLPPLPCRVAWCLPSLACRVQTPLLRDHSLSSSFCFHDCPSPYFFDARLGRWLVDGDGRTTEEKAGGGGMTFLPAPLQFHHILPFDAMPCFLLPLALYARTTTRLAFPCAVHAGAAHGLLAFSRTHTTPPA